MGGSFWDRPDRYSQSLIGLVSTLKDRQKDAIKTIISSGNVSAKKRRQELYVLNGVNNYLDHLGLPPTLSTAKEVMAFTTWCGVSFS